MNFPFLLPRLLALATAAWVALAASVPLHAETNTPPERDEEMSERSEGAARDQPEEAVRLMRYAEIAVKRSRIGSALRRYKEVIEDYSTSALAPEAHFESALLSIERKQWSNAFDHLQAIVDGYPDYPDFHDVIAKQFEISEALRTGARLRLFWLVPGFRSPVRAVEYFEQIVENAPFSEFAPEALIKAARLQEDLNKLDEAIDLYDRFISDYPDNKRAPDAYFGLAEAFKSRVAGPEYDQGANREAISYYEDFVLLFPDHSRVGEAEAEIEAMREILAQSRVVLGDFYFFRRSNLTAAEVFYNEAITISPVSATADEARDKLREVEQQTEEL